MDAITQAVVVNASTNATPPYWVHAVQPYTQYTVRVRYANEYGAAAYSDDLHLTTEPDGKRSTSRSILYTLVLK